jgi:hypothetical protein
MDKLQELEQALAERKVSWDTLTSVAKALILDSRGDWSEAHSRSIKERLKLNARYTPTRTVKRAISLTHGTGTDK